MSYNIIQDPQLVNSNEIKIEAKNGDPGIQPRICGYKTVYQLETRRGDCEDPNVNDLLRLQPWLLMKATMMNSQYLFVTVTYVAAFRTEKVQLAMNLLH